MHPIATLVAIVNYRTGPLVVDCLRSLAPEIAAVGPRFGPVKALVVDNASGDDSDALIENSIAAAGGWSAWAQLRRLDRNGGFAWGNNAAIRIASELAVAPEFIWLLNPDTIVRPGALATLLGFMQAHPRAGIAGSRLEDPDGTVQRSAFRFPSIAGEIDNGVRLGVASRILARSVVAPEPPTEACQVDWLSGASLLVRRQVFEAVGLMDERFFMYFEETDLCRRAKAANWECWHVPQSRVVHLVGQAGASLRQANARRPGYWFDSRRRYFLKHLGKTRTLLADSLFMAGFATWRLRRRLQGKPDPDPVHFLGDFARNSVWRRGFRLS